MAIQMDLTKLREYFGLKLLAEKQVIDVVYAVKHSGPGLFLLDIRDRDDYREGHIEGAVSMPLDEIDRRYQDLPRDKEIVTYCYSQSCHLSTEAALKLVEHGIPAREMNVGWKEWVSAGYPTHSSNTAVNCEGRCRTVVSAN